MDTPYDDAGPPGVNRETEQALHHLKEAERDLATAREAERRAEGEIREAEREIEEAVAHRHTEIVVNSRPREVDGHVAAFEQVVQLAFPGAAADQNTAYSMTYRHAASQPHAGELGPGGRVDVKDGTIFNVTRTVRS